jgi:hypothetical protein
VYDINGHTSTPRGWHETRRDTARGGFKLVITYIIVQPLGIIYTHNIILLKRMILTSKDEFKGLTGIEIFSWRF